MIQIRNLIVIYPSTPVNITANRGIDLDISSKGIKVITGPNGSGKSTLFKVLAGELNPNAGEVMFHGNLVSKKDVSKVLKESVAYAKQDFALNPEWSGSRHLGNSKEVDTTLLSKLLIDLEISDCWDLPIADLTRDQRQLVGLTLTLLSKKPVLLLDEPTKYLNGKSRIQLLSVIKKISKSRSILIATHDPFWTTQSKDAVHIQEGRVVQNGLKNTSDGFGWIFSGTLKKPKSLKQLKKHRNIKQCDDLSQFMEKLTNSVKEFRYFDPELITYDEVTPSELFINQKIKVPTQLHPHADQRIRTLSGGERSWTYLYSLLSKKPKEIFLLYPTLNLDQSNQESLQKMVIGLANRGSKITIFDID